jgi:hypothetical protein
MNDQTQCLKVKKRYFFFLGWREYAVHAPSASASASAIRVGTSSATSPRPSHERRAVPPIGRRPAAAAACAPAESYCM